MNLLEIKRQVMFQTGNDAEDLGDFLPHLTDYINEGYDRMLLAMRRVRLSENGAFPPLKNDRSMPELPEWTHRAIADFATWMVYRNGSAQKQNRGVIFLRAFEEALSRARLGGGLYITNIPK